MATVSTITKALQTWVLAHIPPYFVTWGIPPASHENKCAVATLAVTQPIIVRIRLLPSESSQAAIRINHGCPNTTNTEHIPTFT